MNFENAFIGPQSIQVCHLRSKTHMTSVDRLRGPPRPIHVAAGRHACSALPLSLFLSLPVLPRRPQLLRVAPAPLACPGRSPHPGREPAICPASASVPRAHAWLARCAPPPPRHAPPPQGRRSRGGKHVRRGRSALPRHGRPASPAGDAGDRATQLGDGGSRGSRR